MPKLDEVLKNNLNGLHYGNRLLLPFSCDILKIVIEEDIITDFSPSATGAHYIKHADYTEIYFYDYPELINVVSKYEKIKIIIVEAGKDLFDFNNHRKIAVDILEKHQAKIDEIDEDILFLE